VKSDNYRQPINFFVKIFNAELLKKKNMGLKYENICKRKCGKQKKFFFVWIYILFLWSLSILLFLLNDEIRYFVDPADFSAYFERGKWILGPKAPISEYPQIPTYLFGFNYFLSSFFPSTFQFGAFISIFSLEMAIALFFSVQILYKLLTPEKKALCLLLILPPTVYFTINRFDILPVLFSLIAVYYLNQKKWGRASIFLAIATLTKWYPILLFPGAIIYSYTVEKRFLGRVFIFYFLTIALIILPTFIIGGIEAFAFPYQFHIARGMEYVSIPLLIHDLLKKTDLVNLNLTMYFVIFFLLQVISPVSILLIKLKNIETLFNHFVLVISMFILFSRIDSPQWFLWLIPFLILTAKNKFDVWLIAIFSFSTYLFFPVAFDVFGPSSAQFKWAGISWYILLSVFVLRSIKRLQFRGFQKILIKGNI